MRFLFPALAVFVVVVVVVVAAAAAAAAAALHNEPSSAAPANPTYRVHTPSAQYGECTTKRNTQKNHFGSLISE